jgi:hypothetical protein
MSRIGRVAAHFMVGLYPRRWRARYELELRGLIDEMDPDANDAVDLAASAVREHLAGGTTMRFEPAYRHPFAFAATALVLMGPTLLFVLLSIVGHELGFSAVAAVVDPVLVAITRPRAVDLALVIAPAIALLLAVLPLLDLGLERDDRTPTVAIRVRALPSNLAVAGIAALLGAALVAHIVAESVLHAGA